MADSMDRLNEGDNPNKPPRFDGKFFSQWKQRMETYIKSQSFMVWMVVSQGDTTITEMVGNERKEKPQDHWTGDDCRKIENNFKARHLILCGLNPVEQKRVMGCTTAKEMWELLEITHEGTDEVKESKVDLLMIQYEQFSMKQEEDINGMFIRFLNIVNELNSLGKKIEERDQIRKILRSMPQKKWEAKTTAIQEMRDKSLTMQALNGKLLTYEIQMNNEHTRRDDETKRHGLALKAAEIDENLDADEFAMFVRRFRRYKFNKAGRGGKKASTSRNQPNAESNCYKCGRTGHWIKDCPRWENDGKKGQEKKEFPRKKSNEAYLAQEAAWGNSDDENFSDIDSENEDKHKALMALGDESEQEVYDSDSNFNISELSHAKLIKFSKKLMNELDRVENNKLDIEQGFVSLRDDWKESQRENEQLKNQLFTMKSSYVSLETKVIKVETELQNLRDLPSTSGTKEDTKLGELVLSQEVQLIVLTLENENLRKNLNETLKENGDLKTDLEKLRLQFSKLNSDLEIAKRVNTFSEEKKDNGLSKAANVLMKPLGENSSKSGYKTKPDQRSGLHLKHTRNPGTYERRICIRCGGLGHFGDQCPKMIKATERSTVPLLDKGKNVQVISVKEIKTPTVPLNGPKRKTQRKPTKAGPKRKVPAKHYPRKTHTPRWNGGQNQYYGPHVYGYDYYGNPCFEHYYDPHYNYMQEYHYDPYVHFGHDHSYNHNLNYGYGYDYNGDYDNGYYSYNYVRPTANKAKRSVPKKNKGPQYNWILKPTNK